MQTAGGGGLRSIDADRLLRFARQASHFHFSDRLSGGILRGRKHKIADEAALFLRCGARRLEPRWQRELRYGWWQQKIAMVVRGSSVMTGTARKPAPIMPRERRIPAALPVAGAARIGVQQPAGVILAEHGE